MHFLPATFSSTPLRRRRIPLSISSLRSSLRGTSISQTFIHASRDRICIFTGEIFAHQQIAGASQGVFAFLKSNPLLFFDAPLVTLYLSQQSHQFMAVLGNHGSTLFKASSHSQTQKRFFPAKINFFHGFAVASILKRVTCPFVRKKLENRSRKTCSN